VSHVVVVGSMGVGKTTVGRPLAERLGMGFFDGDDELRARAGKTAAAIAATEGADALHRREADLLLELLDEPDPAVVAAAASIVEDERAVRRLTTDDVTVVWLRARPATLKRRALAGSHRPFVHDDPSAVARLDAQRRDAYAALADVTVHVDDRTPDALVDEVANTLASL